MKNDILLKALTRAAYSYPRKTKPTDDPLLREAAVEWLQEAEKRIPLAIKEFKANKYKSEHARDLAFYLSNIVMTAWYQRMFKH